jgi:site-specific recombinase XerD
LAPLFERAVDSLSAALEPSTVRAYRSAVRNFLTYLGTAHPDVGQLDQLRRDPHILGWLARLRSHTPPFSTGYCILLLVCVRGVFNELAVTEHKPDLAHLLRREDVPRLPQQLPRPLTAEQDQLLQQELLRRNDLGANVFLLIRHTGIRIGECVDLRTDCLRSMGSEQWAIHVPLGKLKTERMVPVDSFVCQLVQRLRFFRSLDPLPADGLLLARPGTRVALIRQLRDYLHQVRHSLGIPTAIVPHQLRHTYATEMLRSGVSFPAVMKLLGHRSANMTMRYVQITLTDLQREFHQARSQPRYLAPQPKTARATLRSGLPGVLDSLLAAQHLLEMLRRSLPVDAPRRRLGRLSNRLAKLLSELRQLGPPPK